MKTYKIIFSPTGGTDKVLDILCGDFEDVQTIDLSCDEDFGKYEFSAEDVCLFGIPSFAGRVPAVATKRWEQLNGNCARAVLVCVYGNRAYDDTLLEMKNVADASGFRPVAAIAANAEHSIVRAYGSGRPDSDDVADLKKFIADVKADLEEHLDKKTIEVPGNHPYKEMGKNALIPLVEDTCIECGLCAEKCPVGAIPKDAANTTDGEKCIGCMRCLAICPVEARKLDEKILGGLAERLKEPCRERKANELFL